MGKLSYKIKGNAKFKPIRAYNDGIKTIIELPKDRASGNTAVKNLTAEQINAYKDNRLAELQNALESPTKVYAYAAITGTFQTRQAKSR